MIEGFERSDSGIICSFCGRSMFRRFVGSWPITFQFEHGTPGPRLDKDEEIEFCPNNAIVVQQILPSGEWKRVLWYEAR